MRLTFQGLKAAMPAGTRLVDDLECVVSVLLAIGLAHLTQVENVSWAAFSGFMVMRGHVADSVLRGSLRIIGTAVGAIAALFVVPLVVGVWPLAALTCGVVGGASLYLALTTRRAYAWLFAGLTFEMILLDKLERPVEAIGHFAMTRGIEVTAGTVACVVVSTLSALTLRRCWPGTRAPQAAGLGWHPQAFRHAAQGATALGFMPLLGWLFVIPGLAQGAVSIMAVMLVPITTVGTSGLLPVSRKLLHRVAGCLAGAALAFATILTAHGEPLVLLAATAFGVAVGRHIENGVHRFTYVGTQFTLAVLVTLVPDNYAQAAIGPALERLYGIFLGMAVLEPVLVAWHLARPRAGPATL
jgi:uncharacterized membrane protein YccC